MRPLAAALLLALSPSAAPAAGPAPGAEPECKGRVSGAVSGEFACTFGIVLKEGKSYMVVVATEKVPGVVAFQAGSFELRGGLKVRRWTHEELGDGLATLAAEGGALYTASRTELGKRGDVSVALTSVKKRKDGKTAVHGTYTARLVPTNEGRSTEVLLEVAF